MPGSHGRGGGTRVDPEDHRDLALLGAPRGLAHFHLATLIDDEFPDDKFLDDEILENIPAGKYPI